jgi:competence protein ComGC
MKNEKGITLVELLAVLSILMIASVIIYNIFFGVQKNYNNLSGKNNLQQEANLIFSTIKNYHLHNDIYKLSYDPNNKTYLIGTTTANNQLGNNDLIDLKINGNPLPSYPTEQTIHLSITKSISVTIQLRNQQNTYTFDTIIKRY